MPATFNQSVVTNAGRALAAASMASTTPVEFTGVATGSGVYTDAEAAVGELEQATALKSQKQTFSINGKRTVSDDEVRITTVITNDGLSAAYNYNEFGVFARLQGSGDTPILYCIAVIPNDAGTTIPKYTSVTRMSITQSQYIKFSNMDSVTIEIAPDACELLEDAGLNDDLTTTEKGTLVGAINELVSKIGSLASLATTVKTSIVAAINEIVADLSNQTLYFEAVAVSATTGNIATISNSKITSDHVAVACVFANPAAITTEVTCTTSSGSAVLNGTCTSATTATITLSKKRN